MFSSRFFKLWVRLIIFSYLQVYIYIYMCTLLFLILVYLFFNLEGFGMVLSILGNLALPLSCFVNVLCISIYLWTFLRCFLLRKFIIIFLWSFWVLCLALGRLLLIHRYKYFPMFSSKKHFPNLFFMFKSFSHLAFIFK